MSQTLVDSSIGAGYETACCFTTEEEDVLRQVVQGRGKVLNNEHEDTIRDWRLPQEATLTFSSPSPLNKTNNSLNDRLSRFFPAGSLSQAGLRCACRLLHARGTYSSLLLVF